MNKKKDLFLFLILALAFAIRAAHLYFNARTPFYEPLLLDPEYYHKWALRIAGGDLAGEGVFYGLPLYPFFLALIYKATGAALAAVKWTQLFLGVLTVLMVYKIAYKLFDRRVGIVASFGAALYGPLFFHETILIPEALGVFLYAVAFYVTCLLWEAPTSRRAVWAALVTALAALTKAGVILFVPLFAALLFLRRGRAAALRYAALFFLFLLPVTVHNRVHGKDWVFLTSHGGYNFYVGNNPEAEGVFKAPEGVGTNVRSQIESARAAAEKAEGRSLKPSEVSRYWSDRAWAFIRENPGSFLRLCARKALLFFDAREISDVEDYAFTKTLNPFLAAPWVSFAFLGPFFFAGLYFLSRNKFTLPAVLWMAAYLAGLLFFFVNARYRLPMLPLMIPIAAAGGVGLVRTGFERNGRRFIFLVLLIGLGAFVSRLGLVGSSWADDYANAGDAVSLKKDYDSALRFYSQALDEDPDSPKANLAMGITLSKFGRYEEAKKYYEKTIEIKPDSQAYNNLGLWYDAQGYLYEAERHFLKALELDPRMSQAYNNLGMVYGKKGENEKALPEFERSLELNPDSAKAHTNVGLVLYRLGRKEEARKHWRQALEIDPSFTEAEKALRLSENV